MNLDYSEVSAGKSKKPMSLKINTEVFKKCLDFFKKIRESSQFESLQAAASSSPEFAAHFETLNQIEHNLQDNKYATTS